MYLDPLDVWFSDLSDAAGTSLVLGIQTHIQIHL